MNTMKSSKSLWTCLSLFLLLFLGAFNISAEESMPASEKRTEISKTFKVSSSDNLTIDNRYGDVTVTHWDKNEIEIKVVITAKASTDKRVEELFKYVDVELNKSGKTVYGKTSMANFSGTRNNERLNIHYYINKPSRIKSSFELRYGNIYLPRENDAHTTLLVKYGNIHAGDFKDKLLVDCSYGNINLGDLNEAVIDIAYCGGVIVGSGKVLNIDSRYSNGEIRDFEQLNLDLSYGNFSARNLGIANIDAKYSNLDVKQLGKRMYADFSYGSFTIKSVSSDFSEVKAEARYGNLNITLPPNMACEVVAENMRYATYKISDQFNAQTSKNNHSYRSLINNGHASRKIIFSGNGYSNLAVKAQ